MDNSVELMRSIGAVQIDSQSNEYTHIASGLKWNIPLEKSVSFWEKYCH